MRDSFEMKPLVSIVTPCYNMENKIHNYLDSILNQEYTNIELILVNDGSTDGTEKIIKKYIPQFERNGFIIKYIVQKNGGAASALKNGLNYVTGEYLMWPDADDILMNNSVGSKVDYLEKHPEYAFVRTNAYVLKSSDLEDRSNLVVKSKNLKRNNIYKECIRFKTFYCCGCYMIRWSKFLEANPEKYIFETKFGQNIQMLIPMAFKYECGYIDEPQYGYIVYEDSHSHLGGNKTYEKRIDYSRNVEKIITETMQHFPDIPQKDINIVQNDFCKRRMRIAYENGRKSDAINEYKSVTGIKKFDFTLFLMKFKRNKVIDRLLIIDDMFDIIFFQIMNRR